MYRSNRSFNIPPGNPPGIWLFWKFVFKFPPPQAKIPFKCPTQGSIRVIKCAHPGDISQAHELQNDEKNAYSCRTKSLSIQQIIRIQYNKNWETLGVFTTNKTLVQSGGNRCYHNPKQIFCLLPQSINSCIYSGCFDAQWAIFFLFLVPEVYGVTSDNAILGHCRNRFAFQ